MLLPFSVIAAASPLVTTVLLEGEEETEEEERAAESDGAVEPVPLLLQGNKPNGKGADHKDRNNILKLHGKTSCFCLFQ